MKRKTSRLTISVVEGTPAHDWLYGMNQITRGAAAQQALNVYHHLVATSQITMFGAVESIILAPAPAAPAVAPIAPISRVAPVQPVPAPVQHQVPVVAAGGDPSLNREWKAAMEHGSGQTVACAAFAA